LGKLSAPTNNQIYGIPANQFSPSAGTTLKIDEGQQKIKIVRQPTIKFMGFLPINFLPLPEPP